MTAPAVLPGAALDVAAGPDVLPVDVLDTVRVGILRPYGVTSVDLHDGAAVLARVDEIVAMRAALMEQARRFPVRDPWGSMSAHHTPEAARAVHLQDDERELIRAALDAESLVTCAECCDYVARDEHGDYPGMMRHRSRRQGLRYICDGCAYTCEECGELLTGSEAHTLDAVGTLCGDCHENTARYCDGCDHYFHRESSAWLNGTDGRCENCSESHDDDESDEWPILSYHSDERRRDTRAKRDEWSKRTGRLFGVELEVEVHGRTHAREEAARLLLDVANGERTGSERLAFIEHDGSLACGFEIITQPMSLPGQVELWRRVLLAPVVRESLRSHDTTTCGLHVHVNRASVTALTIAKAVVFLNDTRTESLVRAIARRYGSGYAVNSFTKKINREAVHGHNRYELLNTARANTIEFRMFKGSTRLSTVLACVEFSHAVLNWCAVESCAALTVDNFLAWLYRPENGGQDTHNLRRYLEHLPSSFRTRWTLTQKIEQHAARPCTANDTTTGDD